jgi:hypothetical protein
MTPISSRTELSTGQIRKLPIETAKIAVGLNLQHLKVTKSTFSELQSDFSQPHRRKQPPLHPHPSHQVGHLLKLPVPHPSPKLLRLWQTSLLLSRKINLPCSILQVAGKPLLIAEILRTLLIFAQPDIQPSPSAASVQSFRSATNDGCFPRSNLRFPWSNSTTGHCLPSVFPISSAQRLWSATTIHSTPTSTFLCLLAITTYWICIATRHRFLAAANYRCKPI